MSCNINSSLLKNTGVRHVVLDKWFSLNGQARDVVPAHRDLPEEPQGRGHREVGPADEPIIIITNTHVSVSISIISSSINSIMLINIIWLIISLDEPGDEDGVVHRAVKVH